MLKPTRQEKKEHLGLRITPTLRRRLEALRKTYHLSLTETVTQLLESAVAREERAAK